VYCGPTAASALIGADVDEVMRLIQEHRGNDLPVEGTSPQELQKAKHMLREHDDSKTGFLGKGGSPKITTRVAPASETKDAENTQPSLS
jgi:hypothetical protein